MAQFPSQIPSINTSSSTDTLQEAGHTSLHNDTKDEVIAVAGKVGIDNSTDTTTHDYRVRQLEKEHDDDGTHSSNIIGQDQIVDYEHGSNADGEYTKYTNGDLVCRKHRLQLDYSTSDACTGTWTFPLAFIDTNYAITSSLIGPTDSQSPTGFAADASPNTEQISSLGMGSAGTNSISFSVHSAAGQTGFSSGDSMYVSVIAWGRWK